MSFSPCLPAELWIRIFRFTTLSHSIDPRRDYEYRPLLPLREYEYPHNWANTLRVKLSLVKVCRSWREMATELLYEEVGFLPDYGATKTVLEDKSEEGYGRFVRRLTNIPWLYPATLQIAHHCRRLETLTIEVQSRTSIFALWLLDYFPNVPVNAPPPSPYIPSGQNTLPAPLPLSYQLPFLKRMDWTELCYHAGAFHFLSDLLCHTPNLQYLTLSGECTRPELSIYPTVVLPSLTILRIADFKTLKRVREICKWSLPALTHLIIYTHWHDSESEELTLLFKTFGHSLRLVELLGDFTHNVLLHCPNLQELNIMGGFFTSGPFPASHSSLSTIRVHGFQNDKETHDAFSQLCAMSLPALQKVILQGNWTGTTLDDSQFRNLQYTLQERGWSLELEEVIL